MTQLTKAPFWVGQPVKVSGGYRGTQDAVISKVGRKYVTIGHAQYDVETQQIKGGYSGWFRTIEQYEEQERRSEVQARIRKAQSAYGEFRLPLEALEKIAAIVDEYAEVS